MAAAATSSTPSSAQHTATVIFLHGSGGSGEEFHSALSQYCRDLKHVKWICPDAKPRSYTLAGGETMPVWFDRSSLALNSREDPNGIAESVGAIESIIAKEANGVPRSRIVVGGFSQGGCLSYYIAYGRSNPSPFAACISSGSFLPDPSVLFVDSADKPATSIPEELRATPLLMMHGEDDEMIPMRHSTSTHERFRKVLSDVTYLPLPGLDHGIDQRVFRRIKELVQRVLP